MQPTRGFLVVVSASGLALGCGGRSCPLPASTEQPEWADTNADGHVDVNDGVRIARYKLAGGPALACRGQGDLLGAGQVGLEAAAHIWDWLFLGNASTWPAWDDCAYPLAKTEPPSCGKAEITPTVESEVTGAGGTATRFPATVSLRAAGLDAGPDAWSFGVSATGCAVVSATFAGTMSDNMFADPPGIVADGFAHVALVDGGAVTAVVPSWLQATTLPGADQHDGQPVLHLEIEATPPASGCKECTITVAPGLRGKGQPVAAVVGGGGVSYEPTLGTVTVDVCAK